MTKQVNTFTSTTYCAKPASFSGERRKEGGGRRAKRGDWSEEKGDRT